ncbi:fimbria/pilus outer membrane usher protein [Ramlibacter monticola]|uniref:Fimbrial biogenesis outer membrane usher protein n=1 Tax=Ramlibacter monticola TaxID=1926872 RepID=A0A937CVM8_9BURK|nr:fimbrial biogenesis outer membrane usher protein [Ramlibacter monticola]
MALLGAPPATHAQAPAATQAQADELILTVRVNGVARGELMLLRQPQGEFWVRAEDLPQLKLEPVPDARRTVGAVPYYSLQGLGAESVEFDEAQLALAVRFPSRRLEGTVIDLGTRPPPVEVTQPRTSLILSYRLAASNAGQGQPTQVTFDTDANLRLGGLLLRQASRIAAGTDFNGYTRGTTQAIWDNLKAGQRYTAGDVLSSAGQYGTAITGAGLMLTKLYDMTPDVIRQPTATLRASTPVPAEVQVSVDGSTIYRGSVGPGPVTLDNLLLYGGMRNVQVTVTDASGRREVFSEPYLFTDFVLAQGLHEYNYFVGRRSELGADNAWHYREMAWQGFHRYGVTDSVTVGAGGEGNGDFSTLGGGLTLRSDMLGIVSLDLLANRDHETHSTAGGWSARYSYLTPRWSFQAGRREFGTGFRTFLTSDTSPFVQRETRVGVSTQLWQATLSADWVRTEDALGARDTGITRLSYNLNNRTMLTGQLQNTRDSEGRHDWAAFVFLRFDLDARRWIGATARSTSSVRAIDLEAGQMLPQGEGVGYRVGLSEERNAGSNGGSAFATAKWNLRPLSLEFLGTRGGGSQFAEVAASGAVVAVDGAWGLTRQVNDSFALARLGVPQGGVEVLLNNQVQGRTDDRGMLFIPDLGAFGRQDVSINDKQVGMQYELAQRRKTVTPAFRSGTVVDFGGRKLSAVAGIASLVSAGRRTPIVGRAFTLAGPDATLKVETGNGGDFYLENAPPGTYRGRLEADGRAWSCRLAIPEFTEAVLELQEGIVCE